MGYDATNYLPLSISKKSVIEFIKLLDFEGSGDDFYFFKEDDYKYLYGVLLNISKTDDSLMIHTRTPIYCSYHDLHYQNYVIKQLRQRFGGYFISDNGKNRYFSDKQEMTSAAERGCYAAYFRLSNLFSYIYRLLYDFSEDKNQAEMVKYFGAPSNGALLSNISTTYISSVIENYFRQLYVVLLTYSDKRESIITSCRMNSHDLFEVANKSISIEEAVALSMSFQNIAKVNSYMATIDKRIDIKGVLSKPYRRRKESLYDTINRVLEHRHSLVHRLNMDIFYDKKDVLKDIKSIEVALTKVYKHICYIYDWKYDEIVW